MRAAATWERDPVTEVPFVNSATRSGASSTVDSTARVTPRALAGDDVLHRLALAGYRITTACRSCGAPLVDPSSVAAGVGPVCGKRVAK